MKQAPASPARRRVLASAGSVGAAGFAATVLGPAAAQPPVAAPVPATAPEAKRGYHETEHTRKYYRLARY